MRFDVHIHFKADPAMERKLDLILSALNNLEGKVTAMAGELDRLTTEVAENTTVIQSAITLINGLAQQIRDLSTDPAALNALADTLDAQSNALAEAVTANTPPTPTP